MAYGNATPKVNIVIDIETLVNPVSQADIDQAMREYAPPANYKSEAAIEKHKANFLANVVDKLVEDKRFSIGGKRMLSCALGIADEEEGDVTDIQSWISDDLSVVTSGVVEYLNKFRDYRLVGWNHIGFDLPELAKSFYKTNTYPKYKPSKWDLIDLSAHPFRKTKLKDAAKAFGLEFPDVNGSNVATMHAEGRFDEIQQYNESDVRITGQLFIAANTIYSFY
jgi:hypothetical protein